MDRSAKRSMVAGLYGNALEWYDFLLYANFAPLFSELYFPTQTPFLSLIATFSIFAISFLMRPLGGAVIGHYADKIGRRKALILSISLMTASTSCIAFLPGFEQIGLMAPILFSLLRVIQGFAVGGELPGSATFLIEHMLVKRRGLAGSLVLSTAFLGILAGALIAFIFSYVFTPEIMRSYGWRLAYILGGVLGLYGIYLRINATEPNQYLKVKHSEELPLKLVFKKYRKSLILAILFTSIMALGNYILIAYATSFLMKAKNFSLEQAISINFIALLILTLLIPFVGFVSDYINRGRIFMCSLIALFILVLPIFWLLASANWYHALLAQILLSCVLAPMNATVPTMIADLFPTEMRASGTSIGYNIGQAVFGGTLPVVALTLIEITGNDLAPAWYVLVCTLIVIIFTKMLLKRFH